MNYMYGKEIAEHLIPNLCKTCWVDETKKVSPVKLSKVQWLVKRWKRDAISLEANMGHDLASVYEGCARALELALEEDG